MKTIFKNMKTKKAANRKQANKVYREEIKDAATKNDPYPQGWDDEKITDMEHVIVKVGECRTPVEGISEDMHKLCAVGINYANRSGHKLTLLEGAVSYMDIVPYAAIRVRISKAETQPRGEITVTLNFQANKVAKTQTVTLAFDDEDANSQEIHAIIVPIIVDENNIVQPVLAEAPASGNAIVITSTVSGYSIALDTISAADIMNL